MSKPISLRALDIPQIHRFGIGFEPMFDELMRVASQQANSNYPPHNVIKTGENTVLVQVAVAGFAEGEIDIKLEKRVLTIAGENQREDDPEHEYMHRGISSRNFKQVFTLAEHVEVKTATMKNGILSVSLERHVPEEAKAKSIAITY
jgi:molecular chaperone IbpA